MPPWWWHQLSPPSADTKHVRLRWNVISVFPWRCDTIHNTVSPFSDDYFNDVHKLVRRLRVRSSCTCADPASLSSKRAQFKLKLRSWIPLHLLVLNTAHYADLSNLLPESALFPQPRALSTMAFWQFFFSVHNCDNSFDKICYLHSPSY